MRHFQICLGLSLLTPAPALAQVAPAAPAAQPQSVAATEKKICRREEGVGSRLNRKICLTREQWAGKAKAEAEDGSPGRDALATESEPR